MADCPSYCAQAFPTYTQADCNTKFRGGANKVILLKCNTSITDPSDGTEINAAIAAGEAALIESVKVNWDAPSAQTITSYVGCVPDTLATNDWSFQLVDRNVTEESVEFYQGILDDFSGEIGGMIIYECSADRVRYVDAALTLTGGPVFPDQDTDLQRYEWTLTGRFLNMPTIHDTPTGVFD